MNKIIKSYVEETNKFMKAYNDEFINIQNILQDAQENQKYYYFKIQEINIMKKICLMVGKTEEVYKNLDDELNYCKEKIVIYENIIDKCDKKFEQCKRMRDREFKELFEIKKELSLSIVVNRNIFFKIMIKLKKIFCKYENFSKFVLQKHIDKINTIKNENMNVCIKKIKEDTKDFSNEIYKFLNEENFH